MDPNLAVNALVEKINNCINTATTKKRLQKNKLPRKNWITSAIMVSCTTKETLYTLWINNPTSERLKKEYTNYTKILNKVIKEAK